ncbi:hypothetical protein [Winogradskyella sp. PC D3.3]
MEKLFEKYIIKTNTETFLIEEDFPEVGWYLYKIDQNGKIINDYLQNSKDEAMNYAFEKFKIPVNDWVLKIENY